MGAQLEMCFGIDQLTNRPTDRPTDQLPRWYRDFSDNLVT